MGCYDEFRGKCPHCGEPFYSQTKAFSGDLRTHAVGTWVCLDSTRTIYLQCKSECENCNKPIVAFVDGGVLRDFIKPEDVPEGLLVKERPYGVLETVSEKSCGVDLGLASDKTVVAVIEDGIFKDYINTEVLPDSLGKGRDQNNVEGHLMNDKCEKCKGIGYINDELSGTLICDCTFRKAGLGRGAEDYSSAESDKAYLGDGVYVCMDKGDVLVYTDNGIGVTNRVYMDAGILKAFIEYLEKKGML